jgi:autotransporter-associated beta strand protein
MVTLGQAGQGDVTVMASSQNVNIQNPWTVVANTGGTTTLGSANSQGSTFGGSTATAGNITLNGNLTINSWVTQMVNPEALVLEGTISGPGSLTFTTTIQVNGGDPTKVRSELDTFDSFNGDPNTYQGGTIVNAGTLIANGDKALGTGNVVLAASNVQLTMKNGTDYIANTATLSLFDSTDKLNLNFTGTDKVGNLIINGVAQASGTYNKNNLSEISGNGAIQVLGAPLSAKVTSVAHTANGHFLIAGLTNPLLTVTVHTSNNLLAGFDSGVPVTADASGVFQYDDATGLTPRFFKATYP